MENQFTHALYTFQKHMTQFEEMDLCVKLTDFEEVQLQIY